MSSERKLVTLVGTDPSKRKSEIATETRRTLIGTRQVKIITKGRAARGTYLVILGQIDKKPYIEVLHCDKRGVTSLGKAEDVDVQVGRAIAKRFLPEDLYSRYGRRWPWDVDSEWFGRKTLVLYYRDRAIQRKRAAAERKRRWWW